MAFRADPSKLSGFGARYIGQLRGQIEVRIEKEALSILEEFQQDNCPAIERLEEIIATKDQLLQYINDFENATKPVFELINVLQEPITIAGQIVSFLKAIPLPTTIGLPPPIGGVLFSLPVSLTNKFAELLSFAQSLITDLQNDINALDRIRQKIQSKITLIKGRIQGFDLPMLSCIEQLPEQDRIRLLEAIANLPIDQAYDVEEYIYNSPVTGITYTFYIETDPQPLVDDIAIPPSEDGTEPAQVPQPTQQLPPLRFAVAKDPDGVIVRRGEKSYSSSTQVLIDELRFKIDNNLP